MATEAAPSLRERLAGAVASAFALAETCRGAAEGAWRSARRQGLRAAAAELLETLDLQARAQAVLGDMRERALMARAAAKGIAEIAQVRTTILADRASTAAEEFSAAARAKASERPVQAAAVASAGGAAALGAGGAAAGVATGAALGAASGLPLALFTFGLSIPVGAALGGGTGLVVGTAVGATAGAVGGGALGYAKRDALASAADSAIAKAGDGAEYVKGTATASLGYVRGAAVSARARLRSAGTGGSEGAD